MIKPTVGRIVWFYAGREQAQPNAAIVTEVHSDQCISICMFTAAGTPHGYTSVMLLQDGEFIPPGFFCTWMPYQQSQAAKHAAESQTDFQKHVQ